jgi:hypothetical protein
VYLRAVRQSLSGSEDHWRGLRNGSHALRRHRLQLDAGVVGGRQGLHGPIARDKLHRPSIAAGLLGDRRRRRNLLTLLLDGGCHRDFGIRLVGAEDIGRDQAEALSDGGPARAELQRLAKRKVHAAVAGYRMIAVFQRIDAVI